MSLDFDSIDAFVRAYEDRFGENGPLSARIGALRAATSVDDLTSADRALMRAAAHDLLARGNGKGATRLSLWSPGTGRRAPDHKLALALTTHQLSWLQYKKYLEALFASPELHLQTYFKNIYDHPRHPYAQTRAASHDYWQAAGRELAENTNHERLRAAYEKLFTGDWVAVRAEIAAIADEKIFFYGPEQYWFEFLIDTVELTARLQSHDLPLQSRRALELMLASRLQTFHWDIFRGDLFPDADESVNSRLAKKIFQEYDRLFPIILARLIGGGFADIKFDWGPFFWRHRDYVDQGEGDQKNAHRENVANYLIHRWGDGRPYLVDEAPPFNTARKLERFLGHRHFYHALGVMPSCLLADIESRHGGSINPYGLVRFEGDVPATATDLRRVLASDPNPRSLFDRIRRSQGLADLVWWQKPNVVLSGRITRSGALHELVLLTADEFARQESPNYDYFVLHWNWHENNLYLERASGDWWSGLAVAHLWNRLPIVPNHPVERAVVLSTFTPQVNNSEGEGLTWQQFVHYFGRGEDVISRLWSLKRIADPALAARPSKLVLIACPHRRGNQFPVHQVRLVTEREAKAYDEIYAKFTYAWKGTEVYLQEISGRFSTELALEIFQYGKNGGLALSDPVERAVLVASWQGRYQMQDESLQLTWEGLLTYLKINGDHPIKKLWHLMRKENPTLKKHPKGDFMMVGTKGGLAETIHMSGLKVLLATEYDGVPAGGFEVVFGQHKDDLFVRSAKGGGAMEIGMALLYARHHGLPILHDLEQAYVAALWGFRERRMEPGQTMTWEKYENYFANHAGDPIAHLWDILRQANPTLEERPKELILMGTTRGSRPDVPVHANTLATPNATDPKRLGDKMYFKVGFTWNGESYVATSDAGTNSKKVRPLFKSVEIVNSPHRGSDVDDGVVAAYAVVRGGEALVVEQGPLSTVDSRPLTDGEGTQLIAPSVDQEPPSTVDEPLSTAVEGESGVSATHLVSPVVARSVGVAKLVLH